MTKSAHIKHVQTLVVTRVDIGFISHRFMIHDPRGGGDRRHSVICTHQHQQEGESQGPTELYSPAPAHHPRGDTCWDDGLSSVTTFCNDEEILHLQLICMLVCCMMYIFTFCSEMALHQTLSNFAIFINHILKHGSYVIKSCFLKQDK